MHDCDGSASVPNTDVMRDAQRLSRFGVSGNRGAVRRCRSCLEENPGSTASFTARMGELQGMESFVSHCWCFTSCKGKYAVGRLFN